MANDISQSELLTAIDELLEAEARRLAGETLRDDDITILRIAEKHKITEEQARKVAKKVLDPLVEKGGYVKVKCMNPNGGGKVYAWRKI